MSSKKIVANTLYYGVVPKLTIFVNVLMLPLITPYLTTFDYGIQGIVSSYTGLLAMVAPLGLNIHLTNSFFEYPQKYNLVWGRILFLFLISGAIFGAVNMLLLICVLPFSLSWQLISLSFLGSIQVMLFANTWLAQHLFPLVERPKPLVYGNLVATCIGLGASFVLIYYYHQGYWGLIASVAVSTVFSFIIFIKFVWIDYDIRPIIERNLKRLKEMLLIGLPLVPHTLGFVLLISSARIVMSWYKLDYDDIGMYSHGCTMGDYIVIVTTSLVTALSPYMQRTYRANDFISYRKLFYLCQSTSIVASFIFCIWMNEIYGVLIKNDNLKLSASIACLMCFARVQTPLYDFVSVSCFVERKTKQLLWLVFFPGIMNVLLCLVLIPIYGYRIAAYTTMFSYWSQILIPLIIPYFKNRTKLWLGSGIKLVLLYVTIIITLICGNLVSNYGVVIRLLVTFIASAIFLIYYHRSQIFKLL